MTDPKWYHTYTQDQWQKNYESAMQALHKNHNDPEAMQALRESADALNAYDQEGVQQTKLSDIPNELGTVAHGLVDEAKGIPAGIGKVIHDTRTGHLGDVGNDIYSGMKQMGSNILAPSDLALQELANGIQTGDPTVAPDEFNSGLRHGGAAMTDIAAVRAPGVIKNTAGSFSGSTSGGSVFSKLGKAAQFVPGPIGKVARGMKTVGELPSNISENYALKNALMKARLQQMGQNITKSDATMSDLIKQAELRTNTIQQNLNQRAALHPDAVEQAGLKTNQMHQNVAEKAGTLHEDVKRPGLQNELTRLQIEKLKKMLDKMNEEGEDEGGAGAVPPKPPNDVLGPGGNKVYDPNAVSDPYGLNDLKNTKAPPGMKDNIMDKLTLPNDELGNFIGKLRGEAEAPHDILGPEDMGTKPITPDELNRILGDILKKPPNNGPNK